MTDNICFNCGSDNTTDYPVCPSCSKTCHFTDRNPCLHCVHENMMWAEQDDSAAEIYVQPIRDFANERGLDPSLLEEYVTAMQKNRPRRVICQTCNDEGYVWVDGIPNFDNPSGDYQVACECQEVRREFYGDQFHGTTVEVPF